jgi:hypothetical protein
VRERAGRSEAYDDLGGGRYLTVYGVGDGQDQRWRLAAFDARSGARRWDVALAPLAPDRIGPIRATAAHVYVSRTSSLDVFDAKTGDLVGTLGEETRR